MKATQSQIDKIKEMHGLIGDYDVDEPDLSSITKEEAQQWIDNYEEMYENIDFIEEQELRDDLPDYDLND